MKQFIFSACLLATALAMTGCPKQLPILAVILSNNDGTSKAPITLAEIDKWVDTANITYTGHGYQFTFDHNDVVDVKTTMLNRVPVVPAGWQPDPAHGLYFSEQDMYDMFANSIAAGYPDKLVVFFRNEGGGGWSWGPPQLRYISMPSYTHTGISKPNPAIWNPNDTLLAHEAGHYLGLPHTFTGVACNAATLSNTDGDKDGQDAYTTADDITDTAPDPNADCAPTTSFDCSNPTVVVNGHTFTPPWTNIMTYHDCFPESISLDQRKVITLTLQDPMRAGIPK
jgi:hypothetical protein